jgi:Porin subfamily
LWGGAGWVRYDNTARTEYCAAYGAAVAGQGVTYSCNPNYSLAMVGIVTRWTPVKNFTFSAELGFIALQQGFSGTATFTPGAPQPVQTWTYHNQDTAYLNVRVQRNF